MSEQRFTLEHMEQSESSPLMPLVHGKRDELRFMVGNTRLRVHCLSQRHLLVVLLLLVLSGLALIVLYGQQWDHWDGMVSGFRGVSHRRNETFAQTLEREVRVMCLVMTTPNYHKTRAVHILRTWGRRCTKIYFMTSGPDDELPTLILKSIDKYSLMWGKIKEAFTYVYNNEMHEADWFLKIDDDGYVFMENLRYLLYPYSPDMAIHFGYNFKLLGSSERNASYMSGGSGYVLSREAVRVFVENMNDRTKCRQENDSAEDVEIGRCLYKMGIPAGDSRDDKLRNRFQPMAPFTTLISHYDGMDFWYFKYAYYNPRTCMECVSDYPAAFHYISPNELYVFEYFNYQFERNGRSQIRESLPLRIPPEQVIIPPRDNPM